MNRNFTVSIRRSSSPNQSEWLGTFPSFQLAAAFVAGLYQTQPKQKLSWSTTADTAWLIPEGVVRVVQFGQPVHPTENIGSVPQMLIREIA